MRAVLNWGWVRVRGPSMTPTVQDGDRVLVHYGAIVRPGQVVLAWFPAGPEMPVLKRASEHADGGWWLLSDNRRAGADSRSYGPGQVLAVAVRLWPTAPSRRMPSRRGLSRRMPGRRGLSRQVLSRGPSRRRRLLGQPLAAAPPDGL